MNISKKAIVVSLACLYASSGLTMPKVDLTPGATGGIDKVVVESWKLSDAEKKSYARGRSMMGQLAAVALAYPAAGRVNQLVKVSSLNRACYYNPWNNDEHARYEFDLLAFGLRAGVHDLIVIPGGEGKCMTVYPYIIAKPVVAGRYRSTATTRALMGGASAFQDSNGNINISG